MKKLIFVLILFSVMTSAVFAEGCNMQAKSTREFFAELPVLGTCTAIVPSPLNILFRTETINFQVTLRDGAQKNFMVMENDGKIIKIKEGISKNPTYLVGLGECEFDTLLRSNVKPGIIKYLYDDNKISVTPLGFWKRLAFGIAVVAVSVGIEPSEVTVACSA